MGAEDQGSVSDRPFVLLESFDSERGGRSFLFEGPVAQVQAHRMEEVG